MHANYLRVTPTDLPDRDPRLPMLGFVLGTGLGLYLWALVGSFFWTVLS